jgi:hypothetical protein
MEPFIFHYIKLCLFLSVGLYIVEDNGYDKLPQKISRRFFPRWGGNKQNKKKTIMECISGQKGRSQIYESEAKVPLRIKNIIPNGFAMDKLSYFKSLSFDVKVQKKLSFTKDINL